LEARVKIDGRCHCGAISYEAEIDRDKVMICHCTDCQSLSGSAFRTVVLTREGSFRLLSGRPKIYVKTGESGARRQQAFCPDCGSPIYSARADGEVKVHAIRVGTVRQRRELQPQTQVWSRSALPWLPQLDAIRSIEKQ
jgi:hypothetical protein